MRACVALLARLQQHAALPMRLSRTQDSDNRWLPYAAIMMASVCLKDSQRSTNRMVDVPHSCSSVPCLCLLSSLQLQLQQQMHQCHDCTVYWPHDVLASLWVFASQQQCSTSVQKCSFWTAMARLTAVAQCVLCASLLQIGFAPL